MKICVPLSHSLAFVVDDLGYFGLAEKETRKDRPDSWLQTSWFPQPDQALRHALNIQSANSKAKDLLEFIEYSNSVLAELGARITAAIEPVRLREAANG